MLFFVFLSGQFASNLQSLVRITDERIRAQSVNPQSAQVRVILNVVHSGLFFYYYRSVGGPVLWFPFPLLASGPKTRSSWRSPIWGPALEQEALACLPKNSLGRCARKRWAPARRDASQKTL